MKLKKAELPLSGARHNRQSANQTAPFLAAICAICLLLPNILNAQPQKSIDSIKAILARNPKADSNKANRLLVICNYFQESGKPDSSNYYGKLALAAATDAKYTHGIAKIYTSLGHTASDISEFDTAIAAYSRALNYFRMEGNMFGVASSNLNIGSVYEQERDFPQAIGYLLNSLSSAGQLHDSLLTSILLYNLGGLYIMTKDYDKGKAYLQQALKINVKMKRQSGIANTLAGLGALYINKGEYDSALVYLMKAYMNDSIRNDIYNLNSVANDIGIIYANKKDYSKALYYYHKALDIANATGDRISIADLNGNVGMCYFRMENYPKAEKYVQQALIIIHEIKNLEGEKSWNKLLSEIYVKTGKWKEAYEAYKNYSVAKDSMQSTENTKKMVSAEMKFEYDKKRAIEDANEQKKNAIAEAEKRKQKIITWSVAGGLLLLLIFSAFILRSLRITKQQKKIIELKNAETEFQKTKLEEKQKEILDSITYAQRIQHALLASDRLLGSYLKEYFILYKPKDIVSGDFYWAACRNNRFYLAVCDSTGHGVPGAFMSLLNISFLYEAITEKNITEPNEVFNHARKRLIENISQDGSQDGMDGILLSLPVQLSAGKGNKIQADDAGKVLLSYSAAYNAPVVVRNGTVTELNTDKMPVGASPRENDPFGLHTVEVQKGDMLYAFSDGFSDQFGGMQGKKFKYKQVLQKLTELSGLPVEKQKLELEKSFEDWKGNMEQVDDLLVVGIRIT